jgi:hypothetical protein
VPSRLVLFDHTFIQTAPAYKVVRASAFHLRYGLTYLAAGIRRRFFPSRQHAGKLFHFTGAQIESGFAGMEPGLINRSSEEEASLILKL